MTACVAVWPGTGRMEVWGAFPGEPDLLARGQADGCGGDYLLMAQRGELRTYAGRITPVAEFLTDCAARLEGQSVIVCGADRFRQAEIITELQKAGIRWDIEWRGTGASATADGSHDVRAFQRKVIAGRIRIGENMMMESAVKASRVGYDTRGQSSG